MKNYLKLPVIYLSISNIFLFSLIIHENNQRLNNIEMINNTLEQVVNTQKSEAEAIKSIVNALDTLRKNNESAAHLIPTIAEKPIYMDSKDFMEKYHEQQKQLNPTPEPKV